MKKLYTYFIVLFFLYSCNPVKHIPTNEYLLTKNTIIVNNSSKKTKHLKEYLVQRPNYRSIGIPLSLYFYNIGNPYGAKEVDNWIIKNPNKFKLYSNIFSKKQAKAIARSRIGTNQWFLNNGEAPAIISSEKTKKSEQNLKTYMQNKGYFNAQVYSKQKKVDTKKAELTFFINKGEPIKIDSLSFEIKSPSLDSLYKGNRNSFLRHRQYNNEDFIKEADRLTKLFRNNGIYHFNKNDISFNIDTLKGNYRAHVHTFIRNRTIEKNDEYIVKPYRVQTIKKINVYTDFSLKKQNYQPTLRKTYKGVNFYSEKKLRYKPRHLIESIFIRPNKIYSDALTNLTRTHLKSLKNFKTTTIKFKDISDTELEVDIYLSPSESYSFNVSSQVSRSNIRTSDLSAKFSFTNKNTFRGTELLKFSGFGSYFKTEKNLGWDFGGEISFEIPRFVDPFNLDRLIPKSMYPKTRFLLGASFQKNIGLDRMVWNSGIEYNWKQSKKMFTQLELLNTEYIHHYNVFRYFKIYGSEFKKIKKVLNTRNDSPNKLISYDKTLAYINSVSKDYNFKNKHPKIHQDLENVLNRHNIITSNFILLVSSYAFTYNGQESFKDNNFTFLKVRVANSGLGLGYLIKEENSRDKTTAFQTPLAQYVKLDTEMKRFWNLSRNSVLGIRFLGGIIIPYNKSDIPFTKSYFAGGSNDIRAWKTYELGPGTRPKGLEYNVGNLKLLGNVEYRFDLISSFKGALFVDAGNIWNISKTDINDEKAEIKNVNPFKSIAVGTGIGLRYDLKFLVGRLDLGFKVREPYLQGNRWFQNFTLNQSNLNIGINYPF